jgi:hypothetical protein
MGMSFWCHDEIILKRLPRTQAASLGGLPLLNFMVAAWGSTFEMAILRPQVGRLAQSQCVVTGGTTGLVQLVRFGYRSNDMV